MASLESAPVMASAGASISLSGNQSQNQNQNQSQNQNPRRRNRNRPKKTNPATPSDSNSEADTSSNTTDNNNGRRGANNARPNDSNNRPNQRVRQADLSKVVRKPQTQNPHRLSRREQEIEQLRRGFPSLVNEDGDPTKFRMKLVPSDPDFPFDIQALDFNLYIPLNYPSKSRPPREGTDRAPPTPAFPVIVVLNKDIPRGFSVNIDMGFKSLSESYSQSGQSLLNLIVALDKGLEGYLKQEKRDTIKIVKINNNRPRPTIPDFSDSSVIESSSASTNTHRLNAPPTIFVPPEVKKERQAQINKLLHSLKESSMWMLSSDKSEDVYELTISCKEPSDIPAKLKGIMSFNLHIPSSYGIVDPVFIIFPNLEDDFPSSRIENNFNQFARDHKEWKLISLINFLACRVGDLMADDYETEESGARDNDEETEKPEKASKVNSAEVQDKARKILSSLMKRPSPEIPIAGPSESAPVGDIQEEEEEEDDSADDSADDEVRLNYETIKPRGIALLLPSMNMTHVGILECTTINLVVSCDRCGTHNDLFNIVSGPYGRDSKPVASSCTKCNAVLACSFQKNLLHPHMNGTPTVGYLDMSGCAPADILSGTFVPTCENCTSSNQDAPFKRAELQKSTTLNCRTCHIRMTLQLGEDGFRFELVSDDKLSTERLKGVRVKKTDIVKQKLGLTSGQPLPDDGKCTHYRKSTRWYRYSCCGKVFPCDKCHDVESTHPYEHGTRIICGKCSREQNFAGSCVYCRHKFDNRSNTGFWEGGKGTRDPTKLNRNDRRKHKKIPPAKK